MTKKSLQEYCNKQGLKVKILFVKESDCNDYYAIYTFDLDYNPQDRAYATTDFIIEPEMDELFEDEEDFVFCVKLRQERKSEVKDND